MYCQWVNFWCDVGTGPLCRSSQKKFTLNKCWLWMFEFKIFSCSNEKFYTICNTIFFWSGYLVQCSCHILISLLCNMLHCMVGTNITCHFFLEILTKILNRLFGGQTRKNWQYWAPQWISWGSESKSSLKAITMGQCLLWDFLADNDLNYLSVTGN